MFNFFSKPLPAATLCFSTDIHCHVIPGIDDGAQSAESAADLIENMQRWGIGRIIASPHVTQGIFENDRTTIEPALAALKSELAARGNGIDVSHSAEYRIDQLLLDRLDAGDMMPLPNGYMLIENSFMQEPWNLDQLIFDLQVRGYKPILAHPERYSYYYNRKARYADLHGKGLAFQINLLSLAGAYGKYEAKMARYLIDAGLVDFIGTDLHRRSHVDAIDAYLTTKEAHTDMERLSGVVLNDTMLNSEY